MSEAGAHAAGSRSGPPFFHLGEAEEVPTAEAEAWLTALLSACRAALEKAENPDFPASADLIEDLRRFTAEVERKLARARSTDAAS